MVHVLHPLPSPNHTPSRVRPPQGIVAPMASSRPAGVSVGVGEEVYVSVCAYASQVSPGKDIQYTYERYPRPRKWRCAIRAGRYIKHSRHGFPPITRTTHGLSHGINNLRSYTTCGIASQQPVGDNIIPRVCAAAIPTFKRDWLAGRRRRTGLIADERRALRLVFVGLPPYIRNLHRYHG